MVTPAVYPHSTLDLKLRLRTFPISQSNFEANRSRGSWVMIGQTNKEIDKFKIATLYKSITRKRLKYLLMNPVTGVSSSLTDELNFRIKGLGNLSSFFTFMVLSGEGFISVPTVSRDGFISVSTFSKDGFLSIPTFSTDGFESCLLLPNCSRLLCEETILEEVSDSSVCKKRKI